MFAISFPSLAIHLVIFHRSYCNCLYSSIREISFFIFQKTKYFIHIYIFFFYFIFPIYPLLPFITSIHRSSLTLVIAFIFYSTVYTFLIGNYHVFLCYLVFHNCSVSSFVSIFSTLSLSSYCITSISPFLLSSYSFILTLSIFLQ